MSAQINFFAADPCATDFEEAMADAVTSIEEDENEDQSENEDGDENEELTDSFVVKQQRFYTHINDSLNDNESREARIASLHRCEVT